jgi:hypothetical protein
MFNILITEDVVNDKLYYSKCIADNFIIDPAAKFKSVTLEDGTESVRTSVFKSFGTKLRQSEFWNSIDESLKAEPVAVEVPKPKEIKPEVELIQTVATEVAVDETLPTPDPIEKPKVVKGKK